MQHEIMVCKATRSMCSLILIWQRSDVQQWLIAVVVRMVSSDRSIKSQVL